MERETPSYYGILPANVRYCKGLCPSAKILYTELSALTNKQGYCNASNNYFAQLYDVSERAISEWFKKLAQFGFIEIQIIRNENGTFRKIFLPGTNESSNGGMNKSSTPLEENFYTKEYYKKNNTSLNNTSNKKESKKNFTLLFPSEFSPQLIKKVTNFIEYRSEIKKPFKSEKSITQKIENFAKELKQYGEEIVIASIDNAIANGWQGTFINKELLNNFKNTQNIIKDDKGNYADTKEGSQQFILDIREGVSKRFAQRGLLKERDSRF